MGGCEAHEALEDDDKDKLNQTGLFRKIA